MHQREFWSLSGPEKFVEQCLRALVDGRCVVVFAPERATPGLREKVKNSREVERWIWTALDVNDWQDHSPVEILIERFLPNWPDWRPRTTANLVSAFQDTGHVIELRNMNAKAWQTWRCFLSEYCHALSNIPAPARWLFWLELCPEFGSPPQEDVCLTVLTWQGQVSSTDWLQLVQRQLDHEYGNQLSRLEMKIMASTIAQIGQIDLEATTALLSASWEVWCNPLELLRAIYDSRPHWNNTGELSAQELWRIGAADLLDGVWRISSVLLVGREDYRALNQRIWVGQMQVLLPLIEEHRRTIISTYRSDLSIPPFDPAERRYYPSEVEDLEIGQIWFQAKNDRIVFPGNLRQLLSLLKDIRNSLAHFNPVSTSLLTKSNIRLLETKE